MIFLVSLFVSKTVELGSELPHIHVQAHSHIDAGWGVPMLQYVPLVRRVLANVVMHLCGRGKDEVFSWADIAYLHLWWHDAASLAPCNGTDCCGAANLRDAFALLVARDQLVLATGGFVQHDEAVASLFGTVNQLSLGNRWIDSVFTTLVRVGYHVDSFGHSSATPALFLMSGYKFGVLNRIDRLEREARARERKLEFWWRTPYVTGNKSLFVHVLRDHYSRPFITWQSIERELEQHVQSRLVPAYESQSNDYLVSMICSLLAC
jgi:hypothetical protein